MLYVFSSHNIYPERVSWVGAIASFKWDEHVSSFLDFPDAYCIFLSASADHCQEAEDDASQLKIWSVWQAKTSLYALNARRCLVWSTFKRVHQGPGMSFVGF
jgi:hypothetical protein